MQYAKDKCTPKVGVSPKEKETNSIVYLFKIKNIVGNEQKLVELQKHHVFLQPSNSLKHLPNLFYEP